MGHGEITLEAGVAPGERRSITGEQFDNLRLWSLRTGEAVTVRSGQALFRARVLEISSNHAQLLVFERMGGITSFELIILQALPDKERLELIIQKTTELGASVIVPFKARRSIALEEREARQKKAHRWSKIALEAAKQCRRPDIPEIKPYCSFSEALCSAKGLKLILWELEAENTIKSILRDGFCDTVTVMIGPEGGFEGSEVEEAVKNGFVPVSLGTRILRCETASIFAAGIVQYELAKDCTKKT